MNHTSLILCLELTDNKTALTRPNSNILAFEIFYANLTSKFFTWIEIVLHTRQLSNHPHTWTVTERLSYSGHSCSIHNIKGCRNKLLFSLLLRIRENAHLLHFIHNITTATIQHESSFHENLLVTLARGLSVTAFLFPLLSSRQHESSFHETCLWPSPSSSQPKRQENLQIMI